MTIFDHRSLLEEYDNEEGSISKDFIVPCLRKCKRYRRATYSFTSSALNCWAGALAHIIDKNVKVEILCDMSVLCVQDERLKIGIEKSLDEKEKESVLRKYQDEILLQALKFDSDADDYKAKRIVLDWLLANGQLELKFAYPKEKPPERVNIKYHKKMGYFEFSKTEYVAFKGSWNETLLGGGINGEECDVYSSERDGDQSRCNRTIFKINNDWDNLNKKFLNLGVSKEILKVIKERAPKSVDEILEQFPNLYELISNLSEHDDGFHEDGDYVDKPPTEQDLRDYQKEVLDDWDKHNRRGLVEHATGTGKTWTATFGIKRHLRDGNQIALVLVPSELLQKQWQSDIKRLIPNSRVLNVGGDYKLWKKNLSKFSFPDNDPRPKIIIAIINSASSDNFLTNLYQGEHLLVVADEVHRLGSKEFAKTLSIDAGSRLGLSATPERYGDPEGTERIYSYFENSLNPIIKLKDVIGKALVPYQYFPRRCYLSEEELDHWDELSEKISKAYASSPVKEGKKIPSAYFKTLLIQRAKIAKTARSKINLAVNIIKENFEEGQRWLIYCDSITQLEGVYAALSEQNISAMQYYSAMNDASQEETLEVFKGQGGILLSIKCLDEGIDIKAISHALIIASDQNPRQFIQRRGRVLRKDESTNKKRAYLYDLVVSVTENSEHKKTDTLLLAELKRAYEFAMNAENSEAAQRELRLVSRGSGIDTAAIIRDYNDEVDNFEDGSENF